MTGDTYDIFISYASEIREWVYAQIYERLLVCKTRSRQITPRIFFDAVEIQTSDNWHDRIEHGLAHSTRFLLVLSVDYFQKKKDGTRWELDAICARDLSAKTGRICPLIVDTEVLAELRRVKGSFTAIRQHLEPWKYPDVWFHRLCDSLELINTVGDPPFISPPSRAPTEEQISPPEPKTEETPPLPEPSARSATGDRKFQGDEDHPSPAPAAPPKGILGDLLSSAGQAVLPGLTECPGLSENKAVEEFFSVRIRADAWQRFEEHLTNLARLNLPEVELIARLGCTAGAIGPDALLLCRRFEQAAELAQQRLEQDLSLENLRLTGLANLILTLSSELPVVPAARAAMCLITLKYSPDVAYQWPSPAGSPHETVAQAASAGLKALERLAGAWPVAASADREWTAGLAFTDFLAAEEESARLLVGHGRRSIATARGEVAVGYGYLFARLLGGKAHLLNRAHEIKAIREGTEFTSLFPFVFLHGRDRHAEVLANPPAYVDSPHHRLYNEAVHLVADSALSVLRGDLRLASLPVTAERCRQAFICLGRIKWEKGPPPEQAREVFELLGRVVGELREAHRTTPWIVKQLREFCDCVEALLGAQAITTLRDRLETALPRHLARFASDEQDAAAVIRHLEAAEADGVVLAEEEVVMQFRAWLDRCRQGHDQALDQMKKILNVLKSRFPRSDMIPAAEAAIAEPPPAPAPAMALSFEEARRQFQERPTRASRAAFCSAVRSEATRLMESTGPRAVLTFLNRLSAELPQVRELQTMPETLADGWPRDRFAPEAVEVLLGIRSDGNATQGNTSPEAVTPGRLKLKYGARPQGLEKSSFKQDVRRRAAELMASQGPRAVVDFLTELCREFPDVPELASLPSKLAEQWAKQYPPSDLLELLSSVARRDRPAHTVTVKEPAQKLTSDQLVQGEEAARRRMAEYDRQFGPTGENHEQT